MCKICAQTRIHFDFSSVWPLQKRSTSMSKDKQFSLYCSFMSTPNDFIVTSVMLGILSGFEFSYGLVTEFRFKQ